MIFSGVWTSEYQYTSSSRPGVFTGKHLVRAFQSGNTVVFESIPGKNESYVILRLVIGDSIATGSWQETTDPNGYYQGVTYYGAIQLTISHDGKHLEGKWVGFGRDGAINEGPWRLVYKAESLPEKAEQKA